MNVYADNAATTAMSETALNTMIPLLKTGYGNASSLYGVGQTAKEYLENARKTVADCLGAKPNEIYFTSGGSEADNHALLSAAMIGKRKGKTQIISTKFEHHAVLHSLDRLKTMGFDIVLLDVNSDGIVRPEQVAEAITDNTCLVSVMYANNEIGTIQPIREIGKICREKGVIFHTDAVQAAGHIPVNVADDNIDMLSVSAHKFHGPKGVGVLYAKTGIRLTNLIEGGAQERGKRAGTENVPGICAMAAALKEACDNMEENSKKVSAIRDRVIDGLSEIPHSRLNGARSPRLPGNVNFCFEGIEGESILLKLDDLGIQASSGSACTSGSLDPSHVLLAIGVPHEIAHGSLRLTFCETNTLEQADYVVKSVKEVVNYLRNMSPVWRDLETGVAKHII